MYEMLLNFVNNVEFISMLNTLPIYIFKSEPIEWTIFLSYFYNSDMSYEYFSLLSNRFPYLVRCLIVEQSAHMRRNCLNKLRRSYSSHGRGIIHMPTDMIAQSLGIFSEKMLRQFIHAISIPFDSSATPMNIDIKISSLNYDLIDNMNIAVLNNLDLSDKDFTLCEIITTPTFFIKMPDVDVFSTYGFSVDESSEKRLIDYAQNLSSSYIYEDALEEISLLKGILYADVISKQPKSNQIDLTIMKPDDLSYVKAIDVNGDKHNKILLLKDPDILIQLLELQHGTTILSDDRSIIPLKDVILCDSHIESFLSTTDTTASGCIEINKIKLPLWQFRHNPLLGFFTKSISISSGICVVTSSNGISVPLEQFLFDATTMNVLNSTQDEHSLSREQQFVKNTKGAAHLCSTLLSDSTVVECLKYSRKGSTVYDKLSQPHCIVSLMKDSVFVGNFNQFNNCSNDLFIANVLQCTTNSKVVIKDSSNNSYDLKQFVYNAFLLHILSGSLEPASIFDSKYNRYPISQFLFNIHVGRFLDDNVKFSNPQNDSTVETFEQTQFLDNSHSAFRSLNSTIVDSKSLSFDYSASTLLNPITDNVVKPNVDLVSTLFENKITNVEPIYAPSSDWLNNVSTSDIKIDLFANGKTSTRVNSDTTSPNNLNVITNITPLEASHNLFQQIDQTQISEGNISKADPLMQNSSFIAEPFKDNTSIDSILQTLTRSFYDTTFYFLGHSRKDTAVGSLPLKSQLLNDSFQADYKTVNSSHFAEEYVQLILNNIIQKVITDIHSDIYENIQLSPSINFSNVNDSILVDTKHQGLVSTVSPSQGKKRKINYINDFQSLWFNRLITESAFNIYEVTLSEKSCYNIRTASPWCNCVVVFDNLIHTPMLQTHAPNASNLMHLIYLKLFHPELASSERCFSVIYKNNQKLLYGYSEEYGENEPKENKVFVDCNRGLNDVLSGCFKCSSNLSLNVYALSVHDVRLWNRTTEIILQNASSIICLLCDGSKRAGKLIDEIKQKLAGANTDPSNLVPFSPTFYEVVVGNRPWSDPERLSYELSPYDLWVNAIDINCESLHSVCEVIISWAVNSSFWIPKPVFLDVDFFIKDFKRKLLCPLIELRAKYQNKVEWFPYVDSFVHQIYTNYLTNIRQKIDQHLSQCIYPFEKKNHSYFTSFYAVQKNNLLSENDCAKLKLLNRLLRYIEVPSLFHFYTTSIWYFSRGVEECHDAIKNFFNYFELILRVQSDYSINCSNGGPTLSAIKKEMIHKTDMISDDYQPLYCISYMPFFVDFYPSIVEIAYKINFNVQGDYVEIGQSNQLSICLPFNVIRDVFMKQWPSNMIDTFECSELYLNNVEKVVALADKNLSTSKSSKIHIAQTIANYIDNELEKLFSAL